MSGEKKETGLMEQGPIDVSADKELQIAPTTAIAIQEVQGAIIIAKKFPRNIKECWAKLMKSCQRQSFAEKATWSYPRGGHTISGPSVHLAKAAAQSFKNLRWGFSITRDDDEFRSIMGWAWDMEENIRAEYPAHFQKLIQRKGKGWIKPDERDLLELTNSKAARLVRNALLDVIPRDFTEDAMAMCLRTLKDDIKDPEGVKKHLILEFDKVGVTVEMLTDYLKTDNWGPDQLVELQGIVTAINERSAKREDYFRKEQEPTANGTIKTGDMKAGNPEKHQGYHDKPETEKPGKQKGDGF